MTVCTACFYDAYYIGTSFVDSVRVTAAILKIWFSDVQWCHHRTHLRNLFPNRREAWRPTSMTFVFIVSLPIIVNSIFTNVLTEIFRNDLLHVYAQLPDDTQSFSDYMLSNSTFSNSCWRLKMIIRNMTSRAYKGEYFLTLRAYGVANSSKLQLPIFMCTSVIRF